MKRILFIAPLLAVAMAASAQEIAYKANGGINVIPGSATISGKSYLFKEEGDYKSPESETVTILDGSFNTVAEFHPYIPKQEIAWHEETAVSSLKATDLYEVVNADEYERYQTDQPFSYADTTIYINNAANLITYLKVTYDGSSEWESFTDYKGRVAVINGAGNDGYYYNYYYSERFGKALPENYFVIDEGFVKMVYLNYNENYSKIQSIDQNSLTWVPIDSTYQTEIYYANAADIRLYDLDKGEGAFDLEDFSLSQNIFNNDEKWEYAAEAYDSSIPEDDDNYTSSDLGYNNWNINDDGYIEFTRTNYTSPYHSWNCIQIYSQDGTVLSTLKNISDDDLYIYRFGGKTYIKDEVKERTVDGYNYYDVLYLIDPTINSVKEVSRSRLMINPTFVNRGEDVNVTFEDDTHNSTLTVTDASGRVMNTKKLSNGLRNVSVSTSNLAKGVYNVSTTKFGKRSNTQRFIVK